MWRPRRKGISAAARPPRPSLRPGRSLRWRVMVGVLAVLVGGGVATGVAYASIPNSLTGTIQGCYLTTAKPGRPVGSLRVIDAESGKTCGPNEAPLSWNQGRKSVTGIVNQGGTINDINSGSGFAPFNPAPGQEGINLGVFPNAPVVLVQAFGDNAGVSIDSISVPGGNAFCNSSGCPWTVQFHWADGQNHAFEFIAEPT